MTAAVPDLPSEASTTDLLAATAAGDRVAFGRLAARYVDFVFAVALRRLGDRHAAEDVTQTVLMTLARKAARVRPPALAVWLHRTTLRSAANARRSDRRRLARERHAARPEAVTPIVLPEPDPLLPLLDEAIAGLRAADRRLIIERYLRGRSVEGLAADLGLPPATARKRVERAVARLRKHFARRGVPTAGVAVAAALKLAGPSAANASPTALATAACASGAAPAGISVTMLGGGPMKAAAAAMIAGVLLGAGADTPRPRPAQTTAPTTTRPAEYAVTYDVRDLLVERGTGTPGRPAQTRLRDGRLRVTADEVTHDSVRQTLAEAESARSGIANVEVRLLDLDLDAIASPVIRRKLLIAELDRDRVAASLSGPEAKSLCRNLSFRGLSVSVFYGQQAEVTVDGPAQRLRGNVRAMPSPDRQSTAVALTFEVERPGIKENTLRIDGLAWVPKDGAAAYTLPDDPARPGRRAVVVIQATPDVRH